MSTFCTSLSRTGAVALLVALALLAAAGAPAQARTAPPTLPPALAAVAAPTFADDVSFTRWLRGYLNRAHIVQICVVMMLVALFIIIKKFNGHG